MIEVSERAKEKLRNLRGKYVDYKTSQEYGRSAFWKWYDQIKQQILSLDEEDLKLGSNLKYQMKYWGSIAYSKQIFNQQDLIIVEDFKFNLTNFRNWLNHAPLNDDETPQTYNTEELYLNYDRPIEPIHPNGKPIFVKRLGRIYIYQNSLTKLYAVTNKNGSKYTKYVFTDIDSYTPRKYPNIRQQGNVSIIAIGKDGSNNLWTIDSNFQCTQVITENKRYCMLNRIITETINRFLRRELIA